MKENYRKTFKRISSLLLSITLLFVTLLPGNVFSGENLLPSMVLAYHKPNVTILYNETEIGFFDANKDAVYPIIYNGSTYIPLRGASALMGEKIEWVALNQVVFIGKTPSQPYKGMTGQMPTSPGALIPMVNRPSQEIITVYSKPDVKIQYDFEFQFFKDASERDVYPIIYKGSSYLPVRAVAKLMGANIDWDSKTQTITINKEVNIPVVKSEATLALRDLFNQSVELYNQSTAKISTLKKTKDPLVLTQLAKKVSLDYKMTQENGNALKAMDQSKYNNQEIIAYGKLKDFLELAEYYTLVLETIAYLAANGEDYSMYSETFLIFALDSADKMEQARVAIEEL